MRIAICAPFMKSDIWQQRLKQAVPDYELEFEEFYHPQELRTAQHFRYHVCVVALEGAGGREAVVAARQRGAGLPILWFSEDSPGSLPLCEPRTIIFLPPGCSDRELTKALRSVTAFN